MKVTVDVQDLKEVRKSKGLSQVAIANRMGIKRQQYNRYEKKEILPNFVNMRKIAKALQVDYLSVVLYFYI